MQNILQQLKAAMDYDAAGKWENAHAVVQEIEHPLAYRIHGYLHHKEGDLGNAQYWYQRSGFDKLNHDLSSERGEILKLLSNENIQN